MAIYVNEYVRLARDTAGNPLQCGEEPAIASYAIAAGSAGPTLNDKTSFVSIAADMATCVKFGASGAAANAAVDRIAANGSTFRGVPTKSGLVIATIAAAVA